MDLEQLIILIFAIGFSIVGMVLKSKKQKQAQPRAEDYFEDLQLPPEPAIRYDPELLPESLEEIKTSQKRNIYSKFNKNSKNPKKSEEVGAGYKEDKDTTQVVDLENDIELLEPFEGTELQKAFLYSIIFNNTKN